MATGKDLIAKVITKLDYLSPDDAKIAVNSILEYIKEELYKKNRVEIRSFGSLSVRKKRYAGQDKNYNTIYFRMSKNIQEILK